MDAATPVGPPAVEADRSLVIRNLRKDYRPGQPVLKDISLAINGRGTTAIIGPSGAGKSTLIRCINRLADPTAGEILFRGQDLARLTGRELRTARRRIGMVFQEYNLVERLSVIENVLCGRLGYVPVWRAWLRRFPASDIDRAFRLLDAVGLADLATRRADQLSGGQRQRVGIARALMQEPDLVLADEPTSSLDPKTSVDIMELIARRAGERDIPVIINIHNVELARRFADRIVGMSKGEIVFDGPPRALEEKHLLQIYGGEGWLEWATYRHAPRRPASHSRRTGRRGSASSRSRSTRSTPGRSSTSPGSALSPASTRAPASSRACFRRPSRPTSSRCSTPACWRASRSPSSRPSSACCSRCR